MRALTTARRTQSPCYGKRPKDYNDKKIATPCLARLAMTGISFRQPETLLSIKKSLEYSNERA
ncbi:MAG: hypothetical protein IKI11_03820 [Neisseriaceae bacterium]|nr:hypothetical protein [Neisseriaceae bacterium]